MMINDNNDDVIHGFEKEIMRQTRNRNVNQKLRDMMTDFHTKLQDDINKKIMSSEQMTMSENTVPKNQYQQHVERVLRDLVDEGLGIGDVSLEQIYALLNRPTPLLDLDIILETNRYKKDYAVLEIRNPDSQIIKYGVFALFFNDVTYVLTTTNKRLMDETVIVYTESTIDPSIIVDTAYLYEKQIGRTLYLRRFVRRENNPERLTVLTNDTLPMAPISQILTGEIGVTPIGMDLMDLNIIIKNGTYISTTEFEKLDAVISIMMTF